MSDARLYQVLQKIDEDMACDAREAGCPCGGVLHSARYPRKPRGVSPSDLGDGYDKRLSFCCAKEGCRHRTTPPSVRFLGRKVYLGAVVVLATALRHGPTPYRLRRLRELFGVSGRTLERWRNFWRVAFAQSDFWRAGRGRFVPPVAEQELPGSLLERFGGEQPLALMLSFVAPITAGSWAGGMAF